MNINPYRILQVTQNKHFNFYKSVFGGEFIMIQRFKDMPSTEPVPQGVENMIMHVALPIGNGDLLMGTDAPEQMGFSITQGNNFYICITPDSKEETTRLYKGLSEGGKIEMELQDMFWGATMDHSLTSLA